MDGLFSPKSYENKPLNFTYEMHRARWHNANNPRDHIFALLGHPAAKTPKGKMVCVADYTKPAEEVYHEFAVNMLQTGSLLILNAVQNGDVDQGKYLTLYIQLGCLTVKSLTQKPALQHRPIPTWVPQWDRQSTLYNLLGGINSSASSSPTPNHPAKPSFTDANRTLLIDGIPIATVFSTSAPFTTADFHPSSPIIPSLWSSLPESTNRRLSTAAGPPYPTGEPALLAFLETLAAVKRTGVLAAAAPAAQRHADGAAFLARATGEAEEDVVKLGEGGDAPAWMERASGGARGRVFGRCAGGLYALLPPGAREGDEVCVLVGGSTLYCLRGWGDGYRFVGECYVHGFMDGEALGLVERGEGEIRELRIY
jgi:hypothetical protein